MNINDLRLAIAVRLWLAIRLRLNSNAIAQLHPHHRKQQKKQDTTPQQRHRTGICPGTPSLQHLLLWPANHRLQKVCICWRPSKRACWWRLAGSERGADQGHGNCRWIPPDWKLKLSTTKTVSAAFHLNNKEAKRERKIKYNETLPFCSEPNYFGATLDRSLTYRRNLESLRKKLTSRVELGFGWGAGATTLR